MTTNKKPTEQTQQGAKAQAPPAMPKMEVPEFKLESASSARRLPPKVIAIYGPPLSGKTSLAAKLPRPYFLSTDGNAKIQGYVATNLSVKKWQSTIKSALGALKDSDEFDTIVFDVFDQIGEYVADSIVSRYNETLQKKLSPDQFNRDKAKVISDINDMGKSWNTYSLSLQNVLDMAIGTGKNIALLFYNKTAKENGIEHETIALTGGKAVTKVTGKVQAIIRTSYDGLDYRAKLESMRTQPTKEDLETPEWKWFVDWVKSNKISK